MLIPLLYAILLGIVEGITEFLPVSSTGHLRLCEAAMKIDLKDPQWKLFSVFIQIGAICAVIVYFRERIAMLLRGRVTRDTVLTPLEAAVPPSADVGAGGEESIGSNGTRTGVLSYAAPPTGEAPPGARFW